MDVKVKVNSDCCIRPVRVRVTRDAAEERLLGHAHGRVAPDALEAQRGDAVEV